MGDQRTARYVGGVQRGTRSVSFLVRDSDDDEVRVTVPRSKLGALLTALNGFERDFQSQDREKANAQYEDEVRAATFAQMLQLPAERRKVNAPSQGRTPAGRAAAKANGAK